ncbi:MAG: class I SAM-dependent methyltransferase [Caldilineaceae bacterium]|jgi:23S rRNA (cytosine1962-C5)-methyltransferase
MDYRLLDSGNGKRLEIVGPYRLVRPAPQAIWPVSLPEKEWARTDAEYERSAKGGGSWHWNRTVEREFDILFSDLALRIRLTDFGHLGLFPEQADTWQWVRDTIRNRLAEREFNLNILNLFAYTGGSTLAASQAGAHVVHVDAAKGVVDWARENAKLSHMDDRPIRWIVDDALKFVQREVRRGSRYHGIILDPPSFGRGPKGQVFKIENQLMPLLDACSQLLDRDALFVLYTCHTPGFTPLVLSNQLEAYLHKKRGAVESGEMTVLDEQGRQLPGGTYARWLAG